MHMNRRTTFRLLGAAGFALAFAAAAVPRPLAAQAADSGQAKADSAKATATTAQAATQLAQRTGVPGYLLAHPRAVNLTAKQVDRVHKVEDWLVGQDTILRAQWKQITGGRPLRDIQPADRRRLGPQLQPIMQQLRANNAAALDSVDAILNPRQQQKLQTALAEYRQQAQRRAHAGGQAPAQH
jgi:hypothetical protein